MSTYPMVGDRTRGVVTPLLVMLIGVPLEIRNPQTQLKMLAHPQASAVTTVITIARVLFCTGLLLNSKFVLTLIPSVPSAVELPKEQKRTASLTSQLRSDFILQALHDLIADRSGFGIGHRFIRLIGETVRQRLPPRADLFAAIDIEQADVRHGLATRLLDQCLNARRGD